MSECCTECLDAGFRVGESERRWKGPQCPRCLAGSNKVETKALSKKNSRFESQVRAIYAAANPGKLKIPGFIEGLLTKCAGREDQLLEKLRAVYKLESVSVKE